MARYDAASEVVSLDNVMIFRTEVRPQTRVNTYMTTSDRVLVSISMPGVHRFVDLTGNIDEVGRLIDDMKRAVDYVRAADEKRRADIA